MKQKIQLNLPANLNYSALVRHIADEVFGDAKFSKPWCSRLKLVVDELFMNAVRYGSTQDTSVIHTTFMYDENGMEFIIEDDGTGESSISAEELQKKISENEENTDLTRTSGRGLSMITKLWTDGMKISKSQYGGIAITFVKKLETAAALPPPLPPPTGLIQQVAKQVTTPVSETPKVPVPVATALATPTTKSEQKGPVYEIKLSGEIDQSNIEEKVAPIYDQVEVMPEGGTLVLDFSELKYINSTFIGNLAAWHTSLNKKGGRVCLKNVNKEIQEVLSLVGLLEILECPVT